MSEIAPDLPSSAAQTGVQAREVAKERDARRAGQAHGASRQIKTIDEAGSTVETNDDDMAVFTDAEGSGSEGRAFKEEKATPESTDESTAGGITMGKDGQLHVDLEA